MVRGDELKDALLSTNTNTDQATAAVLERIFTAWETLLLKAAAEHLIEGEHSIIEGAKEAKALSVPRHNKFPERVFALLDFLNLSCAFNAPFFQNSCFISFQPLTYCLCILPKSIILYFIYYQLFFFSIFIFLPFIFLYFLS
jgi:hypothetical protein